MCGIFGFYLTEPGSVHGRDVLARMGESIRHRGPDDEGVFVHGPIGVGMRRLSIIDLQTGHQPIGNEDGSLQVVFNGEIYNYMELRRDLLQRGHSFSSTSDTEVIVHLYEEFGKECVQYLKGMFAFAIADVRTQTLFLARDRLGIKPLYYACTPAAMIFGSELKAILRFPEFSRHVDLHALLAYLQFGYVPDPLSIFQGISKLPPGHWLKVRHSESVEIGCYWDPLAYFEDVAESRSEESLVEELRWRLTEAVRSHLISDVPLGAFLSGGIDSSTIVTLMAAASGKKIKTFSIGFEEQTFNELPYARLVSDCLGTEHHELVVGPQSLDCLERVVKHFDEPFADASAIPTRLLAALAGEHVKVVLTGEGGDELFAGYERYVVDEQRKRYEIIARTGSSAILREFTGHLPEGFPGKNYLFNISLPRIERYVDSISHFRPWQIQQLASGELMDSFRKVESNPFTSFIALSHGLDFPARLQYLDLKSYLPGDVLTKTDRMSMARSIEARVPLLDHELVEFAASIPSRYSLRHGETKRLFKQAIEGIIPSKILHRKKSGFAVPLERWFAGGLQPYLSDHLLTDRALRHGYFKRTYIETLYDLFRRTGRSDCLRRLWVLLVFQVWYQAFIENYE